VSSRNVQTRIQDILSAIDSIQQRTAGMNFEIFSENETIVKAVLYDLIIIGEAAINIPVEVQTLAPEIPWRLMSDMRNIMAHEYFRVNFRITWVTIQNNLPPLIAPLQQLQRDIPID
jgi:uncharacterized protein with HEPN domain